MGPVFRGYDTKGGDRRKFDDVATYELVVMGRHIRWNEIHALLIEIYADKQNRWCLQEYLWSKEPTRAQFVVARPYLLAIWEAVKNG